MRYPNGDPGVGIRARFFFLSLISSVIVGALIRTLFDGVVWVYGLLIQGKSGPESITQAKNNVGN